MAASVFYACLIGPGVGADMTELRVEWVLRTKKLNTVDPLRVLTALEGVLLVPLVVTLLLKRWCLVLVLPVLLSARLPVLQDNICMSGNGLVDWDLMTLTTRHCWRCHVWNEVCAICALLLKLILHRNLK